MANEARFKYETQRTLEASGASATNGAFVQANDANYATPDNNSFPDGKFTLGVTFCCAPAAGSVVGLYVQELNIDGANDALPPDSNCKERFLGAFLVDAVKTEQYVSLIARDLLKEGTYYIENLAGQTISAGWTLKVTPLTYVTAAQVKRPRYSILPDRQRGNT